MKKIKIGTKMIPVIYTKACYKTKKIILLSSLVSIVGLGFVVYATTKNTSLISKAYLNPTSSDTRTCIAQDTMSLSQCTQKINLNIVDNIEIQNIITCSDVQQPCNIILNPSVIRPSRSIKIYGASSEAGIRRTYDPGTKIENPNNDLILVKTTSDKIESITISSLVLEENSDFCNSPDICANVIDVLVNQVTINHVHINKSHQRGINIRGAKNLILRNSTIENTAESPIWILHNELGSSQINIEENTFKNNKGNLYYASRGDPNSRSRITNNVFDHNHKVALFHTCPGAPDNACSGGQLLLEQGASYLDITNNIIKNGGIENYCSTLGASGIEFQTGSINNLYIANNYITDNTGSAIAFNPNLTNVSNITISQNIFLNNLRGDVTFHQGESAAKYNVTLSDNCNDPLCAKPVISSAQAITTYNPWAVSVTATNLRPDIYARLIDKEGNIWGNDILTTLATDKTWLSFRLPNNTAPSGCNSNFSCTIQVLLYDPITGISSDAHDLILNQSITPPTSDSPRSFSYSLPPDLPTITNSFINPSYNPWAISANTKNIQTPPVIYLYDNLELWRADIPTSLATDKTWLSFRLPSNTTPSGCTGPGCLVSMRTLTTQGSCRFSNSLPITFLPDKPQINNAGINKEYNPWVVWVTGENLNYATNARIIDNSQLWVIQPVFLSSDKTFVSFSLSSNIPPSQCNITQSCNIQIILIDQYNQTSNIFSLNLPSAIQPPVITNGGVNTSYNPWAIWLTGQNFNNSLLAILYDTTGETWSSNIAVSIATDKSFVSLILPSNIPPSQCNISKTCRISIQLVDTTNFLTSNAFFFTLPVSFP
jgi:hypothetical protein